MKDLLVFATEKELMAFDVAQNESICMEDKISLRYESYSEAEKFCDYLKDYFNIDCFDQMDLAVTIVCCNCNLGVVEKLYTDFRGCKSINIVDVEKLLPVVVNNFCLQKGEQKNFSIMGVAYSVIVSEDGKIVVEQSEKSSNVYELQPQDFDFVYEFVLQRKWDEEKEKQYKELVAREQNTCTENEQLKIDKTTLQQNLDNQQKAFAELQEQNKKLENQLSEKLLVGKRKILSVSEEDITIANRRGASFVGALLYYQRKNELLIKYKNGDIVRKGSRIGGIYKEADGNRSREVIKDLIAESDGQIIILKKNGEIKVGDDYAIICDPSDDVDKVMAWYNKLGR